MSDPHTLRHPLPVFMHHLVDRLSRLHREEPTPHVNGSRNPTHPLNPTPLTRHQYDVLRAVAEQRIQRDVLLGTLEPHLLDGKDATWTLRALVTRGLVQLQAIGAPRLTTHGRRTLSRTDEIDRIQGRTATPPRLPVWSRHAS